MKLNIFLLIILLQTICLQAQNFKVIYVEGQVKIQQTGKTLKKDSQFKKQDELLFSNEKNGLVVINVTNKKAFIVQPKKNKYNQLVTNFRPIPYSINDRPGSILNGISLVNYLNEGHNYLVIGEETHIPVVLTSKGFPVNQDTFFYLGYDYHGIQVNKKLEISQKGLILNKNKLFNAQFTLSEYHHQILKDSLKYIENPDKDTIIQINPNDIKIYDHSYIKYDKNIIGDTLSYFSNMTLNYCDYKNDDTIKIFAHPYPGSNSPVLRDALPFNLIFLEDKAIEDTLNLIIESGIIKDGTDDFYIRLTAFLEQEFDGKLEEEDFENWWKTRNK